MTCVKKLEDTNVLTPRLHSRQSVLEFWENHVNEFPILSEISKIITSIPGTQVSVERSFSALRFILSDLREKLSQENVNNILFVRAKWNRLTDFLKKLFCKNAR